MADTARPGTGTDTHTACGATSSGTPSGAISRHRVPKAGTAAGAVGKGSLGPMHPMEPDMGRVI